MLMDDFFYLQFDWDHKTWRIIELQLIFNDTYQGIGQF